VTQTRRGEKFSRRPRRQGPRGRLCHSAARLARSSPYGGQAQRL